MTAATPPADAAPLPLTRPSPIAPAVRGGPRLAPIERPRSLLVRLFAWFFRRGLGKVMSAIGVVYARMPRLLFPQLLMLRLVQKGLTLDPTLADLVQIRTAFALGCSFCTDLHQAVALRSGRDRRKLRAVFDPSAADARDALTGPERTALELADAMAAGTPDDAVFERARATFDEQAIVELVWLCSFTTYLTSIAKAFRLESDELCALASP